jgi:archaellum biogenesis ATPase FlaH
MPKRLTTGVTAIDRNHGGGVPGGSVVALVAAPDSQSEPLLHEFMEERPTAYITNTLNPLEETGERNRYVNFLNQFKTHLVNTGSVGILHCTDLDRPPLRETTLTIADVVWKLDVSVKGNSVESFLQVTKFRGGDPADETIKLDLGEEVAVDTSRDIA